jgi:AcrR family transcriptional regulator
LELRAGVGKATIYRRYRSKDELVSEAVATLVGETVARLRRRRAESTLQTGCFAAM